ncbi:MAG: hypothetical protein K1X75_04255 [Leptospirales bacterium]|nr:hypothetical protein [Leptospirales bacterium]
MSLTQLVAPLLLLWALGVLFLLIRSEVPWLWRISGLLIFSFYALFFRTELAHAFGALQSNWSEQLWSYLATAWAFLPLFLLLFWPIAVWIAAAARSPGLAHSLLRNLAVLTLFYWLFWMLAAATGFDFSADLRRILPENLPLPALPQPPPAR